MTTTVSLVEDESLLDFIICVLGLIFLSTARYTVNFLLPQTSWFLVFNSFLLGSSLLLDLFPGHEEMLKFDQLSFGVTKVESLSFDDIQVGPSSFDDIQDGSLSFVTFNTSLLLPPSSGSLLLTFKSRLVVKLASSKLKMRRDASKREAGEREATGRGS